MYRPTPPQSNLAVVLPSPAAMPPPRLPTALHRAGRASYSHLATPAPHPHPHSPANARMTRPAPQSAPHRRVPSAAQRSPARRSVSLLAARLPSSLRLPSLRRRPPAPAPRPTLAHCTLAARPQRAPLWREAPSRACPLPSPRLRPSSTPSSRGGLRQSAHQG